MKKTNPLSLQKIFLFGAGLHSQTCIDALEKQDKYEVVGIIDSKKEIGSFVDGYQIIGRIDDLPNLIVKLNVNIGFISIGTNWIRMNVAKQIYKLAPKFEFISVIHPSAVFGKNVVLGKGVFIGAQSFISSSCNIGDFCLVHNKSLLGLHNFMEDFSSISIGSISGGKVFIGECSAITVHATINDRINIGRHSVIGSGSLVLSDIPDYVVAYGQPAEIKRSRKENETYLKSG
jgi:sugar O-acyltransferase (sialic acid O-acetyltransferase NeuD family)